VRSAKLKSLAAIETNEGSFGLCPEAGGDQPRGLDSHRRGQDKLHALASFEHRGSLPMPVIVGVGRGQQNAGVDDDGIGRGSLLR
jgi:hypothetical protein